MKKIEGCMMRTLLLVLVLLCILSFHSNATAIGQVVISQDTATAINQIALLHIGNNRTVWDIAFSPDGQLLAVAESEQSAERVGTVRLWNVQTLQEIDSPPYNQVDAIAIDFSPDGKWFAAAGR